jgi:Zn-dependent M16 (insulinase) family peptidase
MYPEGCGYRSETGGLMKNLRTLGVETIRKVSIKSIKKNNAFFYFNKFTGILLLV